VSWHGSRLEKEGLKEGEKFLTRGEGLPQSNISGLEFFWWLFYWAIERWPVKSQEDSFSLAWVLCGTPVAKGPGG